MRTIKEIRGMSGLSRAEFSRAYHIPLRSLENWETGQRECPSYLPLLLERAVIEDNASAPTCKIYKEHAIIKELGACYYQLLKILNGRHGDVNNPYPNAEIYPTRYFTMVLGKCMSLGMPAALNDRIGLLMDFIDPDDWADSMTKPCPLELRSYFYLGMDSGKYGEKES